MSGRRHQQTSGLAYIYEVSFSRCFFVVIVVVFGFSWCSLWYAVPIFRKESSSLNSGRKILPIRPHIWPSNYTLPRVTWVWHGEINTRKQSVLDWWLLIGVFTSQVSSCSARHLKVTFHAPFNKPTKADNPGVTEHSAGSQWHFHLSSRYTQCWESIWRRQVDWADWSLLTACCQRICLLTTYLFKYELMTGHDETSSGFSIWWFDLIFLNKIYIYRYIIADNGSAVPHWFSPSYNKAYIVSPFPRSVPWLYAHSSTSQSGVLPVEQNRWHRAVCAQRPTHQLISVRFAEGKNQGVPSWN